MEFNTDIWNNKEVHQITFYKFEDIKQCLYDLAKFISGNLQPNRLAGFNVEAILSVQNYY